MRHTDTYTSHRIIDRCACMGKYQHTSYGFDCISFIGESDSEILFRKEPLLGKDKKDTSVSPYMPGRLRQNLATWRRTTQDSFVLSVIDSGYKIDWNNLGPPPPKYSNNSPNCANHLEFINSSIAEAQAMGVICETSREYLNNAMSM